MFRTKPKLTGVTRIEVLERALNILSLRDHSIFELRNKLSDRFGNAELIEEVIQECTQLKYLNDDRFCELAIEQFLRKGKSKFGIQQELKKRGVPQQIILDHLSLLQVDDLEVALRLAEKKMKQLQRLPITKQKSRLGYFLQSRGFGADVVYKVYDRLHLEND